MSPFKAAAIQMKCETGPGAPEKNLRKALALMESARERGAGLMVLPEVFDYGYDLGLIRSSQIPEEPLVAAELAAYARENSVFVSAGVVEKSGGRLFNRAVLLGPEGEVGRYAKAHLFGDLNSGEPALFAQGDAVVSLPTKLGKLGFLICFDLRFPELARSLAVAGVDTCVVSSAWPHSRREHFQTLARARAVENQFFLISANQVGTNSSGMRFAGGSAIYDPLGVSVAEADDEEETALVAEIDYAQTQRVRGFMDCLARRRVDLY